MIDANLVQFVRAGVPALELRAHAGRIPQGSKLPALAILRASGSTPRTQSGARLYSRATFTFAVVAQDEAQAVQVSNAVRDLLDGFKGLLPAPDALPGDTQVESCRCVAEPAPVPFVDGDLVLLQLNQDHFLVFREL